MTILLMMLIFGVIIFVHEFGHFITAKLCGAKIDVFSIGLGPTLLSGKIGETEYRLSLLPLGGYVKSVDPDYPEDLNSNDPEKERYLVNKPAWQKALVFAAGVTFNFIFAMMIAIGMLLYVGKVDVPVNSNVLGGVAEDYPAAEAGLLAGDRIIAINGEKVNNWDDIVNLIAKNKDKSASVEALRGGKLIRVTLTPKFVEEANRYLVGIGPETATKEIGALEAVDLGARSTGGFALAYAKGVWDLITGKASLKKNLGGPIMIFKITADAVKGGWEKIFTWLFTFNIILAIFNILPLPPLDGGHLLILLIEAARGKPLSEEVRGGISVFGWTLLLLLMVYATTNDIGRLFR